MSAARLVQNRSPASSSDFVPDAQLRARVAQHLRAAGAQRRRHVVIVVMVAEDREHSVRRVQR